MTKSSDENFIQLAIDESKKAFADGEKICFGALIVKNGEIISKAHNTARKDNDPTAHAEINAIREASKKLENHHLADCTLYTTCEPCQMCFIASWWAKIQKIVYGIKLQDVKQQGQREVLISCEELNQKSGNTIQIKAGVLKQDCLKSLKTF